MSRAAPSVRLRLDEPDRRGVLHAVRAAADSGRTQWVGWVVPAESIDPLLCHASCGDDDRFLWERAESGERFVAWGRVDETESAGGDRFRDVAAWAERVRSRLHWVGAPRPATAPVFVGGFGFEDEGAPAVEWKGFPAARFVLPGTIGEERDGESRWILLTRVEPGMEAASIEAELEGRLTEAIRASRPRAELAIVGELDVEALRSRNGTAGPEYRVQSDRCHRVFRAQIGQALRDIASGDFEKLVLARRLRVDHDGDLDVGGFLGRLREIYPSCTLVAMGRGEDTFLAATPETLVRVRGDRIETAALAGSAPRGRTPEEDERLASRLQASAKERAEHAHVVDALRTALEPLCDRLEIPASPGLRALFGIQQLETPVTGRLRADASIGVLDLVAALHPTPAVGGVPGPEARAWLRRFEGLDRGWYAAPIGWLDSQGGGDFSVALRSALVRGGLAAGPERAESRAFLFAGAGIVAGSEPEQELVETRIKLRALLAPLTEI